MSNKKHNLLDSIVNYTSDKEKLQSLGNRADHAINSIINLLDSIDEEFEGEEAEDLKRRLFLSIKNRDYRKFEKGLENLAQNEKRKNKGS
ncbi:virion structural protein [Pectobacterium phage vB_PcaM_CBB]|uniref:Structural protein n=1 Tax=Pectobacterium phage vB_PcaM_CBB TaxID=2772511 RepID=A0A1L2CV21_9CAUD|nr:virion structural protein [Pectobacterium phage vB_PcaM_CBB]AMM43856.1 structural protein [Pectobacterium phage vB_PcaM_CBB]